MIALVMCALVVIALCWVTVSPRDAWPFSSYPMFAHYWGNPAVRFFRLSFELADGARLGLPTAAGRLPDEFHRQFAAVWREEGTLGRECVELVETYITVAVRSAPELARARRIEVIATVIHFGTRGRVHRSEHPVWVHEPVIGPVGRA